MLSIASVVTNDGIRKRSDVQPFHQPMARPRLRMIAMAGMRRDQVTHQQVRDAGRGQRHDRADGQVDAADDDHEQLPDGEDAGLGHVARDVAQVALTQEQVGVVAGGREDDRQDDDDDQPEEALEAKGGRDRPVDRVFVEAPPDWPTVTRSTDRPLNGASMRRARCGRHGSLQEQRRPMRSTRSRILRLCTASGTAASRRSRDHVQHEVREGDQSANETSGAAHCQLRGRAEPVRAKPARP